MGKEEIPIETFDALLRDLLAWDLVVPSDGDDGQAWLLAERAQRRLGDLVTPRGPWPAERTVYLDRRCSDCGQRQLTRMRDGRHMCDACWQKELAQPQDNPTAAALAGDRRSRWARRHRQIVAS